MHPTGKAIAIAVWCTFIFWMCLFLSAGFRPAVFVVTGIFFVVVLPLLLMLDERIPVPKLKRIYYVVTPGRLAWVLPTLGLFGAAVGQFTSYFIEAEPLMPYALQPVASPVAGFLIAGYYFEFYRAAKSWRMFKKTGNSWLAVDVARNPDFNPANLTENLDELDEAANSWLLTWTGGIAGLEEGLGKRLNEKSGKMKLRCRVTLLSHEKSGKDEPTEAPGPRLWT